MELETTEDSSTSIAAQIVDIHTRDFCMTQKKEVGLKEGTGLEKWGMLSETS